MKKKRVLLYFFPLSVLHTRQNVTYILLRQIRAGIYLFPKVVINVKHYKRKKRRV